MVTDHEMSAMMADGLLNTVRDAAKGLYGVSNIYPCDDVKRMADEVDKLRRLRAELLDKLHGTPCAEIRWQQERETLKADNERLRAALERLVMAKNEKDRHGDTPVYQALKKGAWEAARAALAAQPAAPEERRTGLRLVMVAATLLDQEDLPDEPSAILCGSIDAIRSLGGLLGDPVDVLPAQPAAPGGDE